VPRCDLARDPVVHEIEARQDAVKGDFGRESAMHAVIVDAHTAATALRALQLRGEPPEKDMFGRAEPDPFPQLADLTADATAQDAFTVAMAADDSVGYIDAFTVVIAMLVFCAGNIVCGAASGLFSLAFGRFVEVFGKLSAMAVCRVTLFKQFDRLLLVANCF
jgi:hypothetical protein